MLFRSTKVFLPKFNARFSVEPRAKTNLHKKLNQAEIKKLESIFSRQYQRTVRSDWTISFNKQWHQLIKEQPVTICKGDIITVEEHLDKSIHFKLRDKYLNSELLPEQPQKLNQKNKNIPWVIAANQPRQYPKPAVDHPWRKTIYNANKLTQKVQVGHF